MFGRIKKGDSVIGMRAIYVRGKHYYRGPLLVRGSYLGKMRDWHMVSTRRGRIYLCSDIRKQD